MPASLLARSVYLIEKVISFLTAGYYPCPVDPARLLIPDRLELIVKYLYIRAYLNRKNFDFFQSLYRKHVIHRTGGKEGQKESIDDYEKSFQKMIHDFAEKGYNRRYPIPVNQYNIIAAGSHRLACCLYYGIPAYVRFSNNKKYIGPWNYWGVRWFREHGFDETELKIILNTYIELKNKNSFIFLVWPPAYAYLDEITAMITQKYTIVGSVTFNFDKALLKTVIEDVYSFENINIYSGIYKKIAYFEKYEAKLELIVVHIDKVTYEKNVCVQAQELKQAIRTEISKKMNDYFLDIVLHSSDNKENTLHLKRIFLDDPDFMTSRQRTGIVYREQFIAFLDEYKRTLLKMKIDPDACCIVGSAPLEVFGLLSCTDIDFIIDQRIRPKYFSKEAQKVSPNVDVVYSGYHHGNERGEIYSDNEIIYDSDKHFFFRGLKCATLQIIKERKQKHNRDKDQDHVRLISSMNKRVQ